jgi:hypothetical protein
MADNKRLVCDDNFTDIIIEFMHLEEVLLIDIYADIII